MYFSPEFKNDLGALSGQRDWLYLDRGGAVMIGVLHVVADAAAALALPLREAGAPATPEAIQAGWDALMGLRAERQYGAEFLPEFYRTAGTGLALDERGIHALLDVDLARIETELRQSLPTFHRFPQPAKEVLVELALHLPAGPAFLQERRWAGLREAVQAEEWAEIAALCPPDEPGRLGEERRRWRTERLQRAVEIAASEEVIDEKMTALLQSLNTLGETARGEIKKIESHVGELADELVNKAKIFLKDLGARMAETDLGEAIQADLARLRTLNADVAEATRVREAAAAQKNGARQDGAQDGAQADAAQDGAQADAAQDAAPTDAAQDAAPTDAAPTDAASPAPPAPRT